MVRTIALAWLLLVFGLGSGYLIREMKWWPFDEVEAVKEFVAGDPEENSTLAEKLKNDLGFDPERHEVEGTSEFQKILASGAFVRVEGLDIRDRREAPIVRVADNAERGYRILFGPFDFQEKFFGAVLLNPDGTVKHTWYVTQEHVDWEHQLDRNTFQHGAEVAPDGTVVVAFDGGTSMSKFDYCSNLVWTAKGGYHHSIAFDNDGNIWAWGRPGQAKKGGVDLVNVDYQTGKLLDRFSIRTLINENPQIDIFSIRQNDLRSGSRWIGDRWHPNDIEPLPAKWAKHYPQFNAGDLLVSLRSLDLVFVVDPKTRIVKWWRVGFVRRQHDPDWNARGTITVFNNNMHQGFSSIVEIDPKSMLFHTVVQGEPYDFYTWHQGKHDELPGGSFLITSPQQGRAFEVNPQGEVTFDFYNLKSAENSNLMKISEARFLPLDYFKNLPSCPEIG